MADIQISDISNGTRQIEDGKYEWIGTGIFDKLMMAVNGNIRVEFDNGRITTTEYSSVYLGAIQSAIAASMDFLLKEKLIEEQIVASQADTAIKQAQNAKDLLLKDEQILKVQEEVDLLQTQDSEMQLNGTKDRLLKTEQILKVQEEVDLLQTQDSEMQLNGTKDRLLKTEQIELVGKQKLLVERQTKGFDDDAKQKLLKQALDSWSVAYSVAQDANSIPDSLKVNVIDSIMKNAYTSLGIVKTNDPIGEA